MRALLFLTGILILIVPEVLRVYWIMPFPGSQVDECIAAAYFLHNYIFLFRTAGILLIAFPFYHYVRYGKWSKKILVIVPVLLYAAIFYLFNYKFLAEKMFYIPKHKVLVDAADNKVSPAQLIIGVEQNGEAKAYPIEIIGYHHQVQDTIGGNPVLITYCTVCRTGRAYSPFVEEKFQHFRLVGMDHFNAMFEDETTKSWWRQVNGEAVAGPLKGNYLKEIFTRQMTLAEWISYYPNTLILQPDSSFLERYKGLKGFDDGTIDSGLERRDSNSWEKKSWVVGISLNHFARAYDWNDLLKRKVVNDTINNIPVVLTLHNDNTSFTTWKSMVGDSALVFVRNDSLQRLQDLQSGSWWDYTGLCTEGHYKGKQLQTVQSYQEFWHSWKTFHPNTTVYKN